MTFVIGLTGSIGMGKSTTAKMFADHGIPVWDADAAVTELYGENGLAVAPIRNICKNLVSGGIVSKFALKTQIQQDPEVLTKVEAIVHPLVAQHRIRFLENTTAPIVLLDIPLLFEKGMEAIVDVVVCVTVDTVSQKQRVLDRGTMSEEQFEFILSKQMPNEKKVAMSDFIVPTDAISSAKAAVNAIVSNIRAGLKNA